MKNQFVLFACLFFCGALFAQEKPKDSKKDCGCSFSSVNNVGMLEGSAGSAFHVQTINGMRFNKWFAGVGLGIDKYKFRTVPLFLDVRRDLLNKINTPFLYADIGASFPWVTDKEENVWGRESDYKTGLYYDAGVGYKLIIGRGRGLLFSGGFSMKHVREIASFATPCFNPPCGFTEGERYDFKLKRFSLKAGLQL